MQPKTAKNWNVSSLFIQEETKFMTYFNIICMSRAVHMSIVTLSSFILHMGLQHHIKKTNIFVKKKKKDRENSNPFLAYLKWLNVVLIKVFKKWNFGIWNACRKLVWGGAIPTVAIVIPLFFSSGALSISSKAMALAFPSSANTYTQRNT